jgi:hypothetical protein
VRFDEVAKTAFDEGRVGLATKVCLASNTVER